jgi:Domain of unknown function (DUF4337)
LFIIFPLGLRRSRSMKAEDAAEMMDQEKQNDRFKQRAAVSIAILAMLLAITGLGGANAGKEATNNNIYAANQYAFYQAKNIRQTDYNLAADAIELAYLQDGSLNAETKAALQAKAEAYRKTAARYESEPETQEGKKELIARAKDYESKRDYALKQDPYFDYAEALLQIAIVLISVSIVATLPWLAIFGGIIGAVGGLLMVNGYTLAVEIPFLAA